MVCSSRVAFSTALFYRSSFRKEYANVLDVMRKSADSFVLKGLFVIIVLVFMFWGVGTLRASRLDVAARVNDEIITKHQFDSAYRRIAAMYQGMGDQTPPQQFIQAQALGQLIDLELLTQEAQRLGFQVDEAELREAIANQRDFQRNGRFDKDFYLQLLQQNGYKPAEFEELQRRRMLAGKVQGVVRSGVHVTDEELKEQFRYENERLTLGFIRVPAAAFLEQVAVNEDDVRAYFVAHQEAYREPDRVRIRLVEFRPENFLADVTPSDEAVLTYYDAHLDEYRRPEEVRARHILFRMEADADEAAKAAVRARAEEVLTKAKGGADFAELATRYSQDATAENGGDLGRFGRGVMVPPFETAAFALEPGQISEIVETPFGLHIIKVEEKSPERVESLESVRAAIVETLKTQQGRQVAMHKAEEAHEQLLDGKDLGAIAAAYGVSVQTPRPFSLHEPIEGLGERPELVKEAFATDAGEAGEIMTFPSGYIIFTVEEHVPSAIPELDAIRGRVEQDLRRERAAGLAKERAEVLRAKIKSAADLEMVAAEDRLAVGRSGDVARRSPYVNEIGNAEALKEAAFRLTLDAPVAPTVFEVDGDAIIAVLEERIPADETRFEAERDALRHRAQVSAENSAMQRFLAHLKAQARLEYGPAFAPAAHS